MIPAEIDRLASAINQLRPDWPTLSLRTFISTNLADRHYRDAIIALGWVAADPATHTPARALEAGPWWRAALADRLTENQPTPTPPRFVPAPTDPHQPDINRAGLANVRKALHKEHP